MNSSVKRTAVMMTSIIYGKEISIEMDSYHLRDISVSLLRFTLRIF